MYPSGYHTRSRLPSDAHAPLSKLAEAAVDMDLGELCVTDHFDFLNENEAPAEGYDWTPAAVQHQQALPIAGERPTLKLGLELDMPHLNPAAVTATRVHSKADFILGSVHNPSPERGGTGLLFLDLSTVQVCYDVLDNYFASLVLLAAIDFYDVLAHLTYPLRYMQAPVALSRYQDATWAILRTAVEKGRGMEVSTCREHVLEEWRPILVPYRGCGGEIVIVGSDVHTPADVDEGVRVIRVLLWGCGSRRVCTYEKHQPVSHTLG